MDTYSALRQLGMTFTSLGGLSLLALGILDAAPDNNPVAFIERIQGKVSLKTPKGKVDLDPKIDEGLILNSGDELDCESGAKVTGVVVQTIKPGEKASSADLCSLKKFPPAKETSLRSEAAYKLNEYSLAGRSKGDETAIFDPPNNGAVLAEAFVVKWRVRPPLDNFTAILQNGDTEVARVPDVDGAKGQLDSPSLRMAVGSLSASPSKSGGLKIVFKFQNGSEQVSAFTVLTRDEEQHLKLDLSQTAESGLFKSVERAAIYDSYRLYGLVAAEYDSALTHAPDSRTLLRAAMQAYARTGDLHRAREIRERLEKIDESSKK